MPASSESFAPIPHSAAIILAAGKGTRMMSLLPKVAHTILGRSLVEWSIAAAKDAGFQRVVVVIGNGEDHMRTLLANAEVELVVQKEQKGTGHAVAVALEQAKIVDGTIAVFYGDTPLVRPDTLRKVSEALQRSPDASAALLTMRPQDPSGYGRVVVGRDGLVDAIIEDKDCSEEERATLQDCNSGMYVFNGCDLALNIKKLNNNNVQGEYYLTDMVKILRDSGKDVCNVFVDDEHELLGVNSQVELAKAAKIMQRRINQMWMRSGVNMLDPNLVWIEPDVVLSRNVKLLPMTFLSGATEVHEGSTIGPNCRLTNTVVGANSIIDETVAQDVIIDEDVSVGPRAYLRPGTHLKRGSHAGTHIEIKNSTVGEGSKVPHLSYIGDTTIGKAVNIGAGSITCNYNGFEKNKTKIGDNTFIGSNTMMVAPVRIGNDVITGAGSTITKDVEDGALGIARAKQENISGYTKSYREKHDQTKEQGR